MSTKYFVEEIIMSDGRKEYWIRSTTSRWIPMSYPYSSLAEAKKECDRWNTLIPTIVSRKQVYP